MDNLDSFIAMMHDNELNAAIADTTANGSTRTLAALQDEKAQRDASDYCNLREPIIKN